MLKTVNFADRLHERMLERNTRLCLGLDPRPEAHPLTDPERHGHDPQAIADAVQKHCLDTLDACSPLICAVKPQVAFFEALGIPGLQVLSRVAALAKILGIPVIMDAKRGDIASTAEAYAKAWLSGPNQGHALTVNPYLGFDTLAPFLQSAESNGGAVFVLVKTSNPGSSDLQDLPIGEVTVALRVAEHLAAHAAHNTNLHGETYTNVGAVVGATHTEQLSAFRRAMPGVMLLLPGLGAQGAQASDLAAAFDIHGLGAIASASRAIHYASNGMDFARVARNNAETLRDELNHALQQR